MHPLRYRVSDFQVASPGIAEERHGWMRRYNFPNESLQARR